MLVAQVSLLVRQGHNVALINYHRITFAENPILQLFALIVQQLLRGVTEEEDLIMLAMSPVPHQTEYARSGSQRSHIATPSIRVQICTLPAASAGTLVGLGTDPGATPRIVPLGGSIATMFPSVVSLLYL